MLRSVESFRIDGAVQERRSTTTATKKNRSTENEKKISAENEIFVLQSQFDFCLAVLKNDLKTF